MSPSKTFNQKIWELTQKIPEGKVTTYKILAEAANTKAYRAVGQALRYNPYAPIVPCHRVVNSDGKVGGYFGSINPKGKEVKKKIMLLRKEGIKIKGNSITDFEKMIIKKLK